MEKKMADNFQSKSLSSKEVAKVYHSNIIKMERKKKKSLPDGSTASNENKNYNNPPPL